MLPSTRHREVVIWDVRDRQARENASRSAASTLCARLDYDVDPARSVHACSTRSAAAWPCPIAAPWATPITTSAKDRRLPPSLGA